MRAKRTKNEPVFNRIQWTVLGILAVIQFMHIVDFVVIMPLARKLEVEFHISTNQFGWLVSSYTFAEFFSGIAGSFFIDRFSRKTSLLIGSAGFIGGNFFCAVAPPGQPIQNYLRVGIFGIFFNIAAIAVANTFKGR